MRATITALLFLGLAVAPAAATADDPETLRRELDKMRQQFESVQQEYAKAVEAVSDRLQRLEARSATAAASPLTAQAPTGPAPGGQAPPASQPTLMDFARPRPPFSLTERTGRGQLLFDIGVVGDFITNITQDNIDKADAGTFAGRENRFFPREIELLFYGQIDPYARGEVRLEAAEEFEDGTRELHLGLAEAHLTLLTLPFDTQAKLGLMRNRFGLLNQSHREGLPQPDQPNVLTRFLGEEGLVESGVELTWLAPLPFYLEALLGLFNGDNEDAFGRGSLKDPLVTGRLRTFFELGNFGAIQVGASGATGETAELRRQTFAAYDVKYKLTPENWRHPLLTLASEGIWSFRDAVVEEETGPEDRTLRRFGWYVYGEVQPWRRWAGGLRYDYTQLLEAPGKEWAIEPYVTFWASDFLRFRLAYKHTKRDNRESFNANDASARSADEVFFQATFFLGAHTPHPF